MSNVSLVSLRAEVNNIPEVNSSENNPLNQTVNTGSSMGDLSRLAKLAASATLDRRLMDSLIREKGPRRWSWKPSRSIKKPQRGKEKI